MIFSGLELLGERPFSDVVIHSTVLAVDGRRMSKSLGTGVDAFEVLERYGADATRYGLLEELADAGRALLLRRDRGGLEALEQALERRAADRHRVRGRRSPPNSPSTLEERWILGRLSQTQRQVEGFLAEFDFAHATDELYHLTFDDFCDWYLEAVKARLYDGDAGARATATAALERLLKLLHPVMPHVTEEIWSHLPGRETRLMVAAWPDAGSSEEAGALERVQEYAQVFRRSGVVPPLEGEERRIFDAVVKPDRAPQGRNGDASAERARLAKEIERAEKQLANERFVANAPAEVVDAERAKLERYRRELDAIGD